MVVKKGRLHVDLICSWDLDDCRPGGVMEQCCCRTRPWASGKICTSVSSDPKNLQQLSKSPYRLLLLTFSVLAMFFVSTNVRLTLYPPDGLADVSMALPEDVRVDDERRPRDLVDGRSLPQGASLLGRHALGTHPSIGVVNMNLEEALDWQGYAQGRRPVRFPVAPVNRSLQWSDFYPEWLDEEGVPKCPPLPFPYVHKDINLDLVVARVPCADGERDIHRLQVLLSAASVATQTGDEEMNVLLISECRPALNVFPCRELVRHDENAWLYRVNLATMRTRLALPVGSCELSFSVTHPGILSNEQRQAYVSMVHTDASYICGAIVLARSIRLSGSTQDLVMLVDESVSPEQRVALAEAGWIVREIQRIRNPYAKPNTYNEWNYSKFRLWQLTEYDKIVFIDSDLLVLRNMDFLFQLPELSASGNDGNRFNSGVMVIEPSDCTFSILMDQIMETRSYNGGDQGYLNEMFPWWHRVPKRLNFLKLFLPNDTQAVEAMNPPGLHAIHYLGVKPWLCFRDYDCNWNLEGHHQYANDLAHAAWFRVHDSMGVVLQRHCWLRTSTKAAREVDRRHAEAANLFDGHWKIKINDPRLEYCSTPPDCDWQEMVRHWSSPNTSST